MNFAACRIRIRSAYKATGGISLPCDVIVLERKWIAAGCFSRELGMLDVKFAFTNYGVSVHLQAVDATPERITALKAHFEIHRSGDWYDRSAIRHVMACCPHFLATC